MRRRIGIDAAPKTLRVYAGLTLVAPIVALAQERARESASVWFAVALMLLLVVFVLRGSKVAWWLATTFLMLVVVSTVLAPPILWWAFVLNLVSLACLLAPESRAHCGVGASSQP